VDQATWLQGEECVGATGCNMYRMPVFRVQLEGNPLHVGRAVRTHIDDDVVDGTFQTTKGLAFAVWRQLIMKATQGVSEMVFRDIALGNMRRYPLLGKFLFTEMTPEHPTVINKRGWFNQENAGQFLRVKFQS